MKPKTMAVLSVTSLVAVVAGGCLVISVAPFYNAKDVVFEPRLVGSWINTTEDSERWRFEKEQTNSYRLTYTTANQTNIMQAHLFKLQGEPFLDLFASDSKSDSVPPAIPSHMLLRILELKPGLEMTSLDYDWLKRFLKGHPDALRHEVLETNDKPDERPIALTANTSELQAFIIQHLESGEAWRDSFTLKRAPQ